MSGNKKKKHESFSHEAIVRALFENYESIYAVDAETWVRARLSLPKAVWEEERLLPAGYQ